MIKKALFIGVTILYNMRDFNVRDNVCTQLESF
jgi:hypothetical protein